MTTRELAEQLGVSIRHIRRWLRRTYPRTAADRYARYVLAPDQVAAARLALMPQTSSKDTNPYHGDWFWEGNVQSAVADYLTSTGWSVVATSDTARKLHGDDIRASKTGRTLRVEVKGYPSLGYADQRRAGERKRTLPDNQAVKWFSHGLLAVLKALNANPLDQVALGLPDHPTYRSLVSQTNRSLSRLGIGVFLASQGGVVHALLAPRVQPANRFVDQPGEVRIIPAKDKRTATS